MEEKKNLQLPENAHRELKKGEEYRPILDPNKKYWEVTPYSVAISACRSPPFRHITPLGRAFC